MLDLHPVVQRITVRRTTRTDYENASAATDWLIAGTGVAIAGGGAATMIDAPNVAPNDTASRTYNPVGSDAATAIGIGAIGAGTALVVIPIVDVIRAQKTSVAVGNITQDGEIIKRGIPCEHVPYGSGSVSGAIAGQSVPLGTTDSAGKLVVDRQAQMSISIAATEVGSASLAPVFAARQGARARCCFGQGDRAQETGG